VVGSEFVPPNHEENIMGEKTDQAKGRVKQATGSLTGDKDLEREGRADRAAGGAKEKVGHAVDAVKDKAKDLLHTD
jgi:uncharacterized protein YjbJ (UPF0337 family)